MNPDPVHERVCRCLADVLALNPAQITPEASLVADLGAESIDFLDLVFSLEQEFGVSISRDDLDFYKSLDLGAPLYEEEGRLNEKGIERIRQMVPGIAPGQLRPGLSKYALVNLITVRTLVEITRRKLAEETK